MFYVLYNEVCPFTSVVYQCSLPVSRRHPPVDKMADAFENITLPELRCGR